MPFSIVSPKRSSSCFSTCATRFALAAQLGIGVTHHPIEVGDQPVEERRFLPELVAVADGPADDPAQHVAAAFAAGDHAVDDQERAGADVVGDHAQAGRQIVLRAGLAHRGADQVLEQVDLVIGVHVLQHRGQPLEAHPGVHRRLRQRVHHALVVAIELHEHEIPDLDVAVAFRLGRPGRAAPDLGAMVVEDLRARAARAGVGHLPEVVARVLRALVVADAHAALRRDADLLRPDVVRLVVVDVDRRPQLFRRQAVHLRQELPREADRVALEVVAEAEVAQHLEERVVARRVADVVEVVVLAAGAHAALRGRRTLVGALVDAEEHVLELDHAGVDEQQRRIVGRHERRRRHDRVPALFEVREEPAPDVGGFHGGGESRFGAPRCIDGRARVGKAADFTRL